MPITDKRPLLTTDQAARYLNVAADQLRRLEQTGELPAVRFAHRLRFRQQDLDNFIERHVSTGGHE